MQGITSTSSFKDILQDDVPLENKGVTSSVKRAYSQMGEAEYHHMRRVRQTVVDSNAVNAPKLSRTLSLSTSFQARIPKLPVHPILCSKPGRLSDRSSQESNDKGKRAKLEKENKRAQEAVEQSRRARCIPSPEEFSSLCKIGDLKKVKAALDAGFDLHAGDLQQETPSLYLYHACSEGNFEVARLLIQQRADLHESDSNRCTPLHIACAHGRVDLAQLLIDAGANIHVIDSNGETPLHKACWYGHLEIAGRLVEAGGRIDAPNFSGLTPLHDACWWGHFGNCSVASYKKN